MRRRGWLLGVLLTVACSSGGQAGDGGAGDGLGNASSPASDASNPNVITPPTRSPTAATSTPPPAGRGGAGAIRTGTGGSGGTSASGIGGAAGPGISFPGPMGPTGIAGMNGTGAAGTGVTTLAASSGPTVDCVGGPCAASNVCVNLDFTFVACVPCGGNDQVCCPPYVPADPFLGGCDLGLACGPNPNFNTSPPLDLVRDVCQVPGSPPPADGRLNHERLILFP